MCCAAQDALPLMFLHTRLYKLLVILLIAICNITYAQECTPYQTPKNWQLDKNKSAAIGYVACFHARGVVAEVGYDRMFVGILAMGEGHQGASYSFLQYEFLIRELRIYGGPVYRLNHDPRLLIGRIGADYRLYKNLYSTFSVLQVNRNLNYIHVGVKAVL